MARWRLAAPHYLKVPGTEWEYKEVDRTTGKQVRKVFPVPLLLDPDQPADWNHRYGDGQGEIIVAYAGKTDNVRDIIFEGDPTPDMIPLDEEAKAITATFATRWKHPIESLEKSYSEHMLDDLQRQVADVRAQTAAQPVEGMSELLKVMKEMMEQNQQVISALVATKAPAVARRA